MTQRLNAVYLILLVNLCLKRINKLYLFIHKENKKTFGGPCSNLPGECDASLGITCQNINGAFTCGYKKSKTITNQYKQIFF